MIDVPCSTLNKILPPGANRLGFGCGGLACDVSRADSLRLLETAIDCGISYFDTARMYGFGRAERVLGKLLVRHRDRIIVASKAGILPASRSIPLRVLNRGIKMVHKAVPQLTSVVPTPSSIHPRFGVFDVAAVRKSLEKSLQQLQTDYLDIFFLHECTEVDVKNPELQVFLQNLQKQGKIRAYGLATGIDETLRIVETLPHLNPVLQIPNSIWNMNIKRLPQGAQGRTITHSTLTGNFHAWAAQLASDESLAKQWELTVQVDPRDKVALARLLLSHALYSNPAGLVIFFSSKPQNIRAAAQVATAPFDMTQINGLNSLIRNNRNAIEEWRDH